MVSRLEQYRPRPRRTYSSKCPTYVALISADYFHRSRQTESRKSTYALSCTCQCRLFWQTAPKKSEKKRHRPAYPLHELKTPEFTYLGIWNTKQWETAARLNSRKRALFVGRTTAYCVIRQILTFLFFFNLYAILERQLRDKQFDSLKLLRDFRIAFHDLRKR